MSDTYTIRDAKEDAAARRLEAFNEADNGFHCLGGEPLDENGEVNVADNPMIHCVPHHALGHCDVCDTYRQHVADHFPDDPELQLNTATIADPTRPNAP